MHKKDNAISLSSKRDNAISLSSKRDNIIDQVFLIKSGWSLTTIQEFLASFRIGKIGPIRVVYRKDGKETKMSICLLTEDLYKVLYEAGYGKPQNTDFIIERYKLYDINLAKYGQKSDQWFIPIPSGKGVSVEEIINEVQSKIAPLAEFNVISANSWKVEVPLKSRETGELKSSCIVTFTKWNVDVETFHRRIAFSKIIIDDTYWSKSDSTGNKIIFKCFWLRHNIKKISDKSYKKKENRDNNSKKEIPRPNYHTISLSDKGSLVNLKSGKKPNLNNIIDDNINRETCDDGICLCDNL